VQPSGIFFVYIENGERGVLMIKVLVVWFLLLTFLVAACSGKPKKKENLPAVWVQRKS